MSQRVQCDVCSKVHEEAIGEGFLDTFFGGGGSPSAKLPRDWCHLSYNYREIDCCSLECLGRVVNHALAKMREGGPR